MLYQVWVGLGRVGLEKLRVASSRVRLGYVRVDKDSMVRLVSDI